MSDHERRIRFEISELAKDVPAHKVRAMRRGRTDAQFLERLRYERAMGDRPRDDSVFNLIMLGRSAGLTEDGVFAMALLIRPGIRKLSSLSKADRMLLSRKICLMEEAGVERETKSVEQAWADLLS